ncbi:RNA ligase family protein [Cohnella candidum]|uniref:DNA ligase (ATP) n=1 Tax=Cohnella candidum TaxID=2674991 RepID=A0A3G3K2P4_9BACL|nr:RNA ligase family protein [Cohnella candidum]AYQ74794.1 DNA ligase [Cohnella candidum]
MEPIYPFEPVISETIPTEPHWRHEIKWDGTRILTYHHQHGTKLFNRKQNERTRHYPELLEVPSYCKASSVILDGEVIALAADGKPSFHEVMRRDLIQKLHRVPEMQRSVPITYMIFDVVYCDGEWVNSRPLSERLELLHGIITPNEHVQLVASHGDGASLFEVMRQQSMEGIVCKDLRSAYALGGKDDRWRKVKNYGDVMAAIGGFTLNGGFVNAVLLGQYDGEGKLWYIGHTGTGKLTKAEWRDLTGILTPMMTNSSPFANRPDRHKDAYWVTPKLTAKVQYSEWRWQEGRALRQPSIQSFVNVPPEQCRLPWT